MAELVGTSGRVFAFEPVPQTFAVLAGNVVTRNLRNVTALNLACGRRTSTVTMSIPEDPLMGEDLYQAAIADDGSCLTTVVCARIDDLALPMERLSLVKIDAEGRDAEVLEGMWNLIERTRPRLVVEHPDSAISSRLIAIGYSPETLPGSPNTIFHPEVNSG